MDVFISYSMRDEFFVKTLSQDLRDSGINVITAEQLAAPGEDWTIKIQSAINKAEAILIILSNNSLNSDHVRSESAFALYGMEKENKKIIPIIIDNNVRNKVPFFLRDIQWIDFSSYGDYYYHLNYNDNLRKLIDSINTIKSDVKETVDKRRVIEALNKALQQERHYFRRIKLKNSYILMTSTGTLLAAMLLSGLIFLLLPKDNSDFNKAVIFLAGMGSSVLIYFLNNIISSWVFSASTDEDKDSINLEVVE